MSYWGTNARAAFSAVSMLVASRVSRSGIPSQVMRAWFTATDCQPAPSATALTTICLAASRSIPERSGLQPVDSRRQCACWQACPSERTASSGNSDTGKISLATGLYRYVLQPLNGRCGNDILGFSSGRGPRAASNRASSPGTRIRGHRLVGTRHGFEFERAVWLLASLRRTPGQDLQEIQVVLLGDLAAGEPLGRDLLRQSAGAAEAILPSRMYRATRTATKINQPRIVGSDDHDWRGERLF